MQGSGGSRLDRSADRVASIILDAPFTIPQHAPRLGELGGEGRRPGPSAALRSRTCPATYSPKCRVPRLRLLGPVLGFGSTVLSLCEPGGDVVGTGWRRSAEGRARCLRHGRACHGTRPTRCVVVCIGPTLAKTFVDRASYSLTQLLSLCYDGGLGGAHDFCSFFDAGDLSTDGVTLFYTRSFSE